MNEKLSKSRQQAEIAFAKIQTALTPLTRAREEHDSQTLERLAKTARLREQRLARERFDKTL